MSINLSIRFKPLRRKLLLRVGELDGCAGSSAQADGPDPGARARSERAAAARRERAFISAGTSGGRGHAISRPAVIAIIRIRIQSPMGRSPELKVGLLCLVGLPKDGTRVQA